MNSQLAQPTEDPRYRETHLNRILTELENTCEHFEEQDRRLVVHVQNLVGTMPEPGTRQDSQPAEPGQPFGEDSSLGRLEAVIDRLRACARRHNFLLETLDETI